MSEFGIVDLNEVSNEAARLNDNQGSFLDQFVPMPDVKPGQTGSVQLRILPPAKGQKLYVYTRVHTINGRKVHCPRPLVNGKWDRNVYCPICEYYNSLWRKVDKLEEEGRKEEAAALKAEARSIKPVERYYYNAIVRKLTDGEGNVKTNVGPRILSVGKTLHQMILRAICGDGTEPALGDVTSIKAGYDFIIKKEVRVTGDEEFPNYDRSNFARESTPAGTPDEVKKWAENLHDLSKLRVIKDKDVLEKELAIHRGLIADDADAFDVDEFDKKFQQVPEESDEAPLAKTAAVETASVVSASGEATVATTDAFAADADLAIESDDLVKELTEGV
jgi:hypothetical protein